MSPKVEAAKDVYTDGQKVVNEVNSNKNSYYTFHNDKNQVVTIDYNVVISMEDPDYMATITLLDKAGKTVARQKHEINGEANTWDVYLPKGTYTIKCKYSGEDFNYLKITPANEVMSKLNLNATSKKKAVKYTGENLYMTYASSSGASKAQWVKIDTSKKRYSFHIEPSICKNAKVALYNSKGKKVKSASLYYGRVDTGRTSRDYYYFDLKKNTGVYYLAIETAPNYVVKVQKDRITAEISYDGKTNYLVNSYSGYTTVSSAKKNITSTFKVYKTTYMELSLWPDNALALYDSKGKKMSKWNGVCYKLSPGTYTLKAKAKKAKTKYDVTVYMQTPEYMSDVVEVKNKKAEFELKDIKANASYTITIDSNSISKAMTMKVYDSENKLIETCKDGSAYFEAKKSGTYRVVVETKQNGAFQYGMRKF